MRRTLACIGAVLFLATLFVSAADAHSLGQSYSRWEIGPEGVDVTARVMDRDLSALSVEYTAGYDSSAKVGDYLAARLYMTAAGAPCEVIEPPQELPDDKGRRTFAWRVRCPNERMLAVHHRVLAEVAPSHRHFVRVVTPDGDIRESLLTGTHNEMALSHDAGRPRARPERPAAVGVIALCALGAVLTLAGSKGGSITAARVGVFAIGIGVGLLAAAVL